MENSSLFQYVIARQTQDIVRTEREVQMNASIKKPKKGAGARLRDFYNNLRKSPMSNDLQETLKKKEAPANNQKDQKKIARPEGEAGLS